MHETAASRTSLVTSLMRARHTRLDPIRLFDDPWGDRLVPESLVDEIRAAARAQLTASASPPEAPVAALVDDYLRASSVYSSVVLRSRFTEDALEAAVQRGVSQYVLIGAGFDSFALRLPKFAASLDVFEVDHPATQGLKRQRLSECGLALPPLLHFISADLSREGLASALARSPFRSEALTFFSWLGVTVYLTRDANLEALRGIAHCAAGGSEIAFTYMDQRALDPRYQSEDFRRLLERVAAAGEPFLSGFDPAAISGDLERCGLTLVEDLDGLQLVKRYDPHNANGFQSSHASHLARAVVRG